MHPLLQEGGSILLHRLVREARSKYEDEDDVDATEVYTSRTKAPRNRKGSGSPRNKGKAHHVTTTKEPPVHFDDDTTPESTLHKLESGVGVMVHTASDKSHIPVWGVFLILLVIVLLIFVAFYFCLAKYWRKFKESDKGQRFKGLDLKSVNLIGQMGKEKACTNSAAFLIVQAFLGCLQSFSTLAAYR